MLVYQLWFDFGINPAQLNGKFVAGLLSVSKATEASLKDSNRRMMGMLESFLEAH